MSNPPSAGWFKATRNPEALELIAANPNAFVLAYVIAARGRWTGMFNPHGLTLGEALIGDFKKCGMTEQQYRTAKQQLEKWKFATFRPTTHGTVAKLTDTRLFDIFPGQDNGQDNGRATDAQRTPNGRPTTNKELKSRRAKEQKQQPALPLGPETPQKALESAKAEQHPPCQEKPNGDGKAIESKASMKQSEPTLTPRPVMQTIDAFMEPGKKLSLVDRARAEEQARRRADLGIAKAGSVR
jgi:hypothetical protein